MPPVGFEELFGHDQPNEPAQWQDASLFKNDSEEIRRRNTIQRGIFFDENEENMADELKDFDPLADLHSMKEKNLDAAERKSVWKMNYQMKNELGEKNKKDMLVNDGLLSKIREICITNVTDQRIEQTKALINKIDAFDEKSHTIEKRLYEIKSHTQQMEEEIPLMDEQIAFLNAELEMMNEQDMTPEEVCSLVEPKSELAQGILKYQSKYLSH